MKPGLSLSLALSTLVAACGTSQLAHQASRDLKCPANQIEVTEIDEIKQQATGCGKTAIYYCSTDMQSRVSCLKERSSVKKVAQEEAAKLFLCPVEKVTLDDGARDLQYDAKGCGRSGTFACRAVADTFRCEKVGGAAVTDDGKPPASASAAPLPAPAPLR